MAKKSSDSAHRLASDSQEVPRRALSQESTSKMSWQSFGILAGIVSVTGILLFELKPLALTLHPDAISHASSFLAVAVILSLFLERALEVFVGVWRDPEQITLDARWSFEEQHQKQASERHDQKEYEAATESLRTLNLQRAAYRIGTQKFAMRAAFAAGLLISVAGLRCLDGLIEPKTSAGSISELQRFLFQLVDVMLTGGLIAGGSEGLHKLSQIYSTFVDTTNKRLREGPPVSPIPSQPTGQPAQPPSKPAAAAAAADPSSTGAPPASGPARS